VDIGQDVDGLGHLGERVAARVERVDHGDHGVGSPWAGTGMKKAPKADASEPVRELEGKREDQAVSRGTMPAALSSAFLAAVLAASSTEASKTSAALDTIAGPRATTSPVLSPAVASTASIRTALATSAPSSPTTWAAGDRRYLPDAVIRPSTEPS